MLVEQQGITATTVTNSGIVGSSSNNGSPWHHRILQQWKLLLVLPIGLPQQQQQQHLLQRTIPAVVMNGSSGSSSTTDSSEVLLSSLSSSSSSLSSSSSSPSSSSLSLQKLPLSGMKQQQQPVPIILVTIVVVVVFMVLNVSYQRKRMYQRFMRANIPTIYYNNWYFLYRRHSSKPKQNQRNTLTTTTDHNNHDANNSNNTSKLLPSYDAMYQHLLSSSNITNVLPRMIRLNSGSSSNTTNTTKNTTTNRIIRNEYDMYATIYGISTSVLHIAHPIPIGSILCGCDTTSNSNSSNSRSSIPPSTKKFPAYQHFQTNFVGNGVFTVDNQSEKYNHHGMTDTTTTIWKQKRSAIIHTLMKYPNSMLQIEREINVVANQLIHTIHDHLLLLSNNNSDTTVPITTTTTTPTTSAINIVPLLQRTTIGFIYQYLTHDRTTFAVSSSLSSLLQQPSSVHRRKTNDKYLGSSKVDNDTVTTTIKTKNPKSINNNNNTNNNENETFVQQYLQSITDIRMVLLAQSRSVFYYIIPSMIYRLMSTLHKIEKYCIMPSIQQMAIIACHKAIPHSPIHQLIHMYPSIYGNTMTPSNNSNNTNTNADSNNDIRSIPNIFSKNILDEVITLLFAGQDTTAATLSWTIHLLSIYPHIQEKLYRHIRIILQSQSQYNNDRNNQNETTNDNGSTNTDNNNNEYIYISKKQVSPMYYLDAVIKESMRLYPVAPFIVRNIGNTLHLPASSTTTTTARTATETPSKTTTTNDNNKKSTILHLPNNTLACIWIYSLHRHPKYWDKPNDYIPERWLVDRSSASSTSSSVKKDAGISTPGAYIPYAIGPRNCLGQPIANIVLRILLVRLILQYEFIDERASKILLQNNKQHPFHDDDEHCISPEIQQQLDLLRKDMQAGFTILPQGGVPLVIRTRSQFVK